MDSFCALLNKVRLKVCSVWQYIYSIRFPIWCHPSKIESSLYQDFHVLYVHIERDKKAYHRKKERGQWKWEIEPISTPKPFPEQSTRCVNFSIHFVQRLLANWHLMGHSLGKVHLINQCKTFQPINRQPSSMKFKIFLLLFLTTILVTCKAQIDYGRKCIKDKFPPPPYAMMRSDGLFKDYKTDVACPYPDEECMDGRCVKMWDFSRTCYSDWHCPSGTQCSYYPTMPIVGDPGYGPLPSPDYKWV